MPNCGSELLVLLGAEPNKRGELGPETTERVKVAIQYLKDHPDAEIFFPEWTIGHTGLGGYGAAVSALLDKEQIDLSRVHSRGKAYTTIDEIILAERFFNAPHGMHHVVFVTSWYHIPRAKLQWYLCARRSVTGVSAGSVTVYTLYRALLEPVKLLFVLCPPDMQKKIGDRARKFGIHR